MKIGSVNVNFVPSIFNSQFLNIQLCLNGVFVQALTIPKIRGIGNRSFQVWRKGPFAMTVNEALRQDRPMSRQGTKG